MATPDQNLVEHVAAFCIGVGASDVDAIVDRVVGHSVVLLGEATHGTREFYAFRAEITKRLIIEHGFNAIAVEADWPDAYRVNRFIRHGGSDDDADSALGSFTRFPRWMWRNEVIEDLVVWLRAHNSDRSPREHVGFYGLDLYSLHRSIEAVLSYLIEHDAEAARRARDRYACFSAFGEDSQAYGYAASTGRIETCEDDVVRQLIDLQMTQPQAGDDPDEVFFVERNAALVKNAERYYREMFRGSVSSWNLRDTHMTETLEALHDHIGKHAEPRIVVWAHNSHLGDARATQMGHAGEVNVGELVRKRFGKRSFLLGFTTFSGSVTAASDWDGPAEFKRVRPALEGSYEWLLHQVGNGTFLLPFGDRAVSDALAPPRLQRAIGVIYRPETERVSHYFDASLPHQFDAIAHVDATTALRPLDDVSGWHGRDAAETFPHAV
ncbi:MAG TPA: erythromycin esterase family protein [Actinomycetota bacterium]|nr:erythromycin esterase family protein [Actinomycetota bacterium]